MTEKKPRKQRRIFTSQEKCQAILSVWSERRKPGDVCKDLGINWAVLNQWQQQAMTGMMEALEPKRKGTQDPGPVLGPRLEKLLDLTVRRRNGGTKLQKRLKTIQSESSTS